MQIDAHHHLWDLTAVRYPWLMERGAVRFFGDPTPIQRDYLIEEFRANARAMGFGASVHIQVGAADGLAEARWIQTVADANPDWPLAQVAFCDLTAPDAPDMLSRLSALPSVRGVRQIVGRAPGEDSQTGTNSLLANPAFAERLALLGDMNLSFDLQLTPELMEPMARLIADTPRTRFALCHAGSPHDRSPSGLADYAHRLEALSALPNLWCKLSGLGMFDHDWTPQSIAPIVETCIAQFSPERLMFGSNFPVDSLYSNYSTLTQAMRSLVPEEAHAAVFGDTARAFYFA
ncbi:putative TIM-barrel fold metal-dependent hydrolase [Aliiruegeria haliotis]|uniref:Putative TIM-barrel fold metal-dependent hydrolase n=1 Tax=Aliiruegeria haliotis TaxID=1280846 RepID=A0A2T0RY26_9RHOB|nr:amidohydrolase family protein [Aliiruegeria haliotis]PRY26085.1 putative TIM-barrel fold metal-dependent hydrolase [Aliiruegeria haliotis]